MQPYDVIGHLAAAAAAENPPADVLPEAGDGPQRQRLWQLASRDGDEGEGYFPDAEEFVAVPPQNPQDTQSLQDLQDLQDLEVPEDALAQQAVDPRVDLERVGGAIETTKEMILLMRLANMLGLQRELQAREAVSQTLNDAYSQLIAVEKTHEQLEGNSE